MDQALTTPAEFSEKQWAILVYAAEHSMGMANVGHGSTAARGLIKRGLVVPMGRDCVQITDLGVATVNRLRTSTTAT
jgi:hypothetical protein